VLAVDRDPLARYVRPVGVAVVTLSAGDPTLKLAPTAHLDRFPDGFAADRCAAPRRHHCAEVCDGTPVFRRT
jgi:hypothetical protein